MSIRLDHVFVCCSPGAPEADALLRLGLKEGTRNVHPGQGTANRRFFFDGGFLELLWVADATEARSALASPTRLWERWSQRRAGACPFGVAFSPAGPEVVPPPFNTWPYRPSYLPADKTILFAKGASLQEPELFYLAWPNTFASSATQPKDHQLPLLRMRSVSVGLPAPGALSEPAAAVAAAGLLRFHRSADYELVLDFESPASIDSNLQPTLPIILRGSPAGAM